MRKNTFRAACLLWAACLAILMGTGCKPQSDAPPPPPPETIQAQPAAGAATPLAATAEAWQQEYYKIALQFLKDEQGNNAHSLALYRPGTGLPLLALRYQPQPVLDESGDTWQTPAAYTRLWGYRGEEAVLLYEGEDTVQINTQTGNPVITKPQDDKTLTVELNGGGETPLYETFAQNGQTLLYTYADDTTWGEEAQLVQQPLRTLPLAGPADELPLFTPNTLLGTPALQSRLSDYFLGTYQPALPQNAPAWVGEFLWYVRTHYDLAYAENLGVNDLELPVAPQEVSLHRPVTGQPSPVLLLQDIAFGNPEKNCYYILGDNGIYSFSLQAIDGYYLYQDETGHVAACEWSEGGIKDWYKPTPGGLQWLFRDGTHQVSAQAVYAQLWEEEPPGSGAEGETSEEALPEVLALSGGECKPFTSWNRATQWVEEQRLALLAQHGYTSAMTLLPAATFPLKGNYTWPMLEEQLIQHFCAYAVALGQMEETPE